MNPENNITDEAIRLTVGAKIHSCRLKAKKTLKQVANDLGLSVSMMSQIEAGKVSPSICNLFRLQTYYKKSFLHFTIGTKREIIDLAKIVNDENKKILTAFSKIKQLVSELV